MGSISLWRRRKLWFVTKMEMTSSCRWEMIIWRWIRWRAEHQLLPYQLSTALFINSVLQKVFHFYFYLNNILTVFNLACVIHCKAVCHLYSRYAWCIWFHFKNQCNSLSKHPNYIKCTWFRANIPLFILNPCKNMAKSCIFELKQISQFDQMMFTNFFGST